jgi:hypothetical protein
VQKLAAAFNSAEIISSIDRAAIECSRKSWSITEGLDTPYRLPNVSNLKVAAAAADVDDPLLKTGRLLLLDIAERINSLGRPPRMSDAQINKLLLESPPPYWFWLSGTGALEGHMTLKAASAFDTESGFPPRPASP